MTNFKNGQAVLCPSLSTKLLYAYHCKTTNGSESIHQLYYNNFTGKWNTIGTPNQPEITVTAPDLIQIN